MPLYKRLSVCLWALSMFLVASKFSHGSDDLDSFVDVCAEVFETLGNDEWCRVEFEDFLRLYQHHHNGESWTHLTVCKNGPINLDNYTEDPDKVEFAGWAMAIAESGRHRSSCLDASDEFHYALCAVKKFYPCQSN